MNFALTTLTVLIIALPGFVLRKSYYSEEFSTNHRKSNLTENIFWAIIPSLLIHSLARILIILFTSYDFNFNIIGFLLSGGNNYHAVELAFININKYYFEIILYFSIIILLCFWLGNALRIKVIKNDWDIIYPKLRFQNEWYYFISGRYTNIAYGPNSYKNLEFVVADILVNAGKNDILYKGFAVDYFMNKKGGLDNIVLAFPSKKEYVINKETEFHEIPSDFLTIDYKQIVNINFSYFEQDDLK
ncbi:MAG: hypothetical protein ACQERU_10000 [Bacteroidota bacterium]